MIKHYIKKIGCYLHYKYINRDYVPYTGAFIGRVEVARYFYDGMISKDDKKKYSVTSHLPSIKKDLGNYETVEECEKKCLDVAIAFCEQLEGE